MPQKWGFSPICDPKVFFKNRALSLLNPYGALTSCKKLEKTNEQSPRYFETDGQTYRLRDGQGRLLWTPSRKPGVQNDQTFFLAGTTAIPLEFLGCPLRIAELSPRDRHFYLLYTGVCFITSALHSHFIRT